MRNSREARRLSRQLVKLSFTDGKLDQEKITKMVGSLVTEKPRHYVEVLKDYQSLIRLEIQKRQATVESAVEIDQGLKDKIVANLRSRYGDDVTVSYKLNSDLLGGLRIKIGDDVWDGSVRQRLNRLQQQFQ
jgi:F-type H+-transporting ATPase subunit delta